MYYFEVNEDGTQRGSKQNLLKLKVGNVVLEYFSEGIGKLPCTDYVVLQPFVDTGKRCPGVPLKFNKENNYKNSRKIDGKNYEFGIKKFS